VPVEKKSTVKRRRRNDAAPRALTLREVAKAAGVSTASASRALTRPDLVSETVKEQVERAARALGYVPNAAAQSLSGHPRRLVGVVLGGLGDPIAAAILDAMEHSLAAHDVALLIATGADTEVETTKRLRELVGRGADAVLFGNGAVPLRPVSGAHANRIPWVALDATDREQNIDSASGFDRAQAHALALRYLRDLGHQRVALMARGADRLAAATRAAMGATDILLSHVVAHEDGEPDIAGWLSSLQALPVAPTALLCASDDLAAAVVDACRRQSIAVPQELAVVGFGDSELARNTRPTLTTIRVPTREAGIAAAEYVFAVLQGRPAPVAKLAVKLIARESSGPLLT
jgi:LacI family transcriptional regulator